MSMFSDDEKMDTKPSFDTSEDLSDPGDRTPAHHADDHKLHDGHSANEHDGLAQTPADGSQPNNYHPDSPHSHGNLSQDDLGLGSDDEGAFYDQNDDDDDMGRHNRNAQPASINVMDLHLARAPDLESTDGEVHTLHIPDFLSIEEEDFNPEVYVTPTFNVASTSLCWRYDPRDNATIQSNARIVRWSDGSMTLQLASNPKEHYQITSKRLARSHAYAHADDYSSYPDAHVYLGVPSAAAEVIRLNSHVTSQLNILPSSLEHDDAVEQLRMSIAAANKNSRKNPDGSVTMIDVKEDPELAKKQAEMAEREKARAEKKRLAAQERELLGGRRGGGFARTGGAGLTVAGLENDNDVGSSRMKKPKRKTTHRGDIYSDDEGQGRRGRTREDEYDEGDGFLVRSDEELETYSDDQESDAAEEDSEPSDDDRKRRARQRPQKAQKPSPTKRPKPESEKEETYVRHKIRYRIDDDDDE
ncbi:hypothetical protein KEM56_000296 [Ascosphaera pollenicola]|nr:hypothetical protein KEM56_000296 [Ascosphaera pollenicola]